MIRLELAAVIDGGSVFRNRTYFFEVDGPLIFVAYDKVMSMFVLKTLSGRMLMWLKVQWLPMHIRIKKQPDWKPMLSASFCQGLITSLPSLILRTVNLLIILKLARLCNPIRLRELHPTPHQLDELFRFKVISSEDAPIGLQQLKDELPMFLALAAAMNRILSSMDRILPFFQSHSHEISTWAKFASLLATQQVSSAAVERVFSFLKSAFKETQEKALSDYV